MNVLEKMSVFALNYCYGGKFLQCELMFGKQIGPMIRFHRKKSGLTQEQVGQLAGLGKTVIFDIEKGKTSVRFDTLLKVMEVLNIKINFQSPLMSLFEEHLNENG